MRCYRATDITQQDNTLVGLERYCLRVTCSSANPFSSLYASYTVTCLRNTLSKLVFTAIYLTHLIQGDCIFSTPRTIGHFESEQFTLAFMETGRRLLPRGPTPKKKPAQEGIPQPAPRAPKRKKQDSSSVENNPKAKKQAVSLV